MTIVVRLTAALIAVLGVAGASSTVLGQNTVAEDVTAASALENARQALAAFSSIEYEFRTESIGPGKQSNQSKRTEWGRFEYADGKSRSEFTIDSDDYKTSGITAFDGKDYQLVRENRFPPFIKADDMHPYVVIQPVMYPFMTFLVRGDLTKQRPTNLETYRGPDFWTGNKDAAVLDGRREVDGHPCVVVKFERKPPYRLANREVCLALDLDCYPILNTVDGGPESLGGTTRIVEFADLKTNPGRVIVPIRIETKSHNPRTGTQSTFTMTVDKQTLKVNEPIDSQRFNLRP